MTLVKKNICIQEGLQGIVFEFEVIDILSGVFEPNVYVKINL